MAEYIEREAALKEFEKVCNVCMALVNKPMCGDCSVADTVRKVKSIPAADVRPVVTCSDCKWWTKQESSLQGRCELLQMYPTGAWFCANGKREES